MKILFQGDSVTDAGRDRSDPHNMGNGYPKFASGMIEDAFPEETFEFLNLGISGARTENLVSVLESDFVEVQPDIVSILIGINDVWHFYSHGIETTDEQFEKNYRQVLETIRAKTRAKILMIEPFLVFADDKANMRPHLDRFIEIIRKLAREYADAYVPMDGIYAASCVNHGEKPSVYSPDGVHPSEEGARVLAQAYLSAISPLIEELSDEK
ncbi:MAG: SGNH/GDSL hydrolase family protein [Clostridia bacterium]|nr:SGNH/GDSL hydrolase family protein [Clostridia bacterium]